MKIYGHQDILRQLGGFPGRNRVPHSLLFYGNSGVGKTACAVWFAQLLNCERPLEQKAEGETAPCGVCSSCRRIESHNYSGFKIFEPPNQVIKIEQIRELSQDAQLAPLEGNYKVYLLKKAEFMTSQAANALLKILEEPPQKTILILSAANTGGIIPTILSRVSKFRFGFLSPAEIREYLTEQLNLEGEELELYAQICQGSPGKARKFHENPGLLEFRSLIYQYLPRLMSAKPVEILDFSEIAEKDAENALDFMLKFYRDLLLVKEELAVSLLANPDQLERLRQLKGDLSNWQVNNILETLNEGKKALPLYVNPKLIMHRTLIRIKEISKEV